MSTKDLFSSCSSPGCRLHLRVAHLLFLLGYWALQSISTILLPLQGWNRLLYQSDSAITCLVPAVLGLTDAVVRACSLFSSNHILPARNLKGSLHLLSSCMDLPTLVLMVQIWNLISCPSTNSAFSTICALLISLINLTLLHFTYLWSGI